MGQGRGKGADQTGAIAAGCGAITCMVLFFVIGLPCLITGIVLIRIAAVDSSGECWTYEDSDYDDSPWSWLRTTTRRPALSFFDDDYASDDCEASEDWKEAQHTMNIIGIVLVVASVLMLVSGLLLTLLMCTSMCRKRGGQVLHVTPAAMTSTTVTSSTMAVSAPMANSYVQQQQLLPPQQQLQQPPTAAAYGNQMIYTPPHSAQLPPQAMVMQPPPYQPQARADVTQTDFKYRPLVDV